MKKKKRAKLKYSPWATRLGDSVGKKSKEMMPIPFGEWFSFCGERGNYKWMVDMVGLLRRLEKLFLSLYTKLDP